ncbi:MAG: sensor histidine kinase [Pseudomonadota bacterium]
MRRWNLEQRLGAVALLWLAAGWGLGGTVLALVFERAAVERFDAKAEILARGLAPTLMPLDDGRIGLTAADPAFDDHSGGWFWIVDAPAGRVVSRADDTLQGLALPSPTADGTAVVSDAIGPDGVDLRASTIAVDGPGGVPTVLTIALDRREIDREIAAFTRLLVVAVVGSGAVLIVLLVVMARVGLAPLRRLRADLAEVENGARESVPIDYPPDVRLVAEAVNTVLERDRARMDWSRKTSGNLAHALKTELALLRQDTTSAATVRATADRIAGIVDHHLARAAAGASATGHGRTDTAGVVTSIANGLARLFADRGLSIEADVAGAVPFRGERQDLEEMIGNLAENACGHATSLVQLHAAAADGRLVVTVDDDGPGLTADAMARATQRGVRLDERAGSAGLGLAIVGDLAELYGGTLALKRSVLGGLACRLELPALTP